MIDRCCRRAFVFSCVTIVCSLITGCYSSVESKTQQHLDRITSDGKWIADNSLRMFTGMSWSDSSHDRRNSAYDCPKNHNTNSYFWKPTAPTPTTSAASSIDDNIIQRFQPYLLCKEMQGRPLAVSGDTTSHTFFETIVNAMSVSSQGLPLSEQQRRRQQQQRVKLPYKEVKRSLKKQRVYGVSFTDVCKRAGYLPFEMVMFDSPLLDFDGGIWEAWLANHTNAVMIINRGAKYQNDITLRNSLMDTLPKYLRLLQQNDKSVLIWRSSQMAHADCESFDRPLRSTQYKASMMAEAPG